MARRKSKPKGIPCLRCRAKVFDLKPGAPCPHCGTRLPSQTELDLLEKQVQLQCVQFMEWEQWRAFRNNPLVAMTAGGAWTRSCEKGTPDYKFVYYFGSFATPSQVTLTLWVEFKRHSETISDDPLDPQAKWHLAERKRGALIWVIDSFEFFKQQYAETFGWLRRGQYGRGQQALFDCVPEELRPCTKS